MSQVKTHFVPKSGNRKTGVVSATYRDRGSCPTECPLLDKGCYAAGRIEGIAHRYGRVSQSWVDRAIAETPAGGVFRHLVVGDLLDNDGHLDADFAASIERLAVERPDVIHIVYTHAWKREDVRAWMRRMFATHGVVVNASCSTTSEVLEASRLGLHPVTVATDADDPILTAPLDGRRPVVCPAQTHGVTCAQCKLCAKGDTDRYTRPVIAFLAHGGGKRAAAATTGRA